MSSVIYYSRSTLCHVYFLCSFPQEDIPPNVVAQETFVKQIDTFYETAYKGDAQHAQLAYLCYGGLHVMFFGLGALWLFG